MGPRGGRGKREVGEGGTGGQKKREGGRGRRGVAGREEEWEEGLREGEKPEEGKLQEQQVGVGEAEGVEEEGDAMLYQMS